MGKKRWGIPPSRRTLIQEGPLKKAIAIVLVALFLGISQLSAQVPTKKYLVLGADPKEKNRQPIAGKEHVVILNDEICDSGWGSGSGKRIVGCYPPHSAAIVDDVTDYVVVMYVCGNDPEQKHKAVGKIVPTAQLAYVPVPGPQGPPGNDGKDGVGTAGPQGPPGLTGKNSSPPKLPEVKHGVNWSKVAVRMGETTLFAAGAYALVKLGQWLGSLIGHNNGNNPGGNTGPAGVPPGGSTGPAFFRIPL